MIKKLISGHLDWRITIGFWIINQIVFLFFENKKYNSDFNYIVVVEFFWELYTDIVMMETFHAWEFH